MAPSENKLHNLMYGLLYPAILGAGIALLIAYGIQVGVHGDLFIQRFSLAVITLLIYCVAYGNSFDPTKYGPSAFLLDIVEIICMGVCFWALGLFYKDFYGPAKFGLFGFSLSFSLLGVQSLWLKKVGQKPTEGRYLVPRVVAVMVILAGSFCSCAPATLADSGALLIILGIYVRRNWG